MSAIKEIRAPIETEMNRFAGYFNTILKSKVPLLGIITNYILRRKGKQLRPMFVFLTAKLSGVINESSFTAAALIELLHTATLVHDDVVDESFERRGVFSINALWKSKVAVLLGDYMLAKGLLLSVKNKEYEILEIVSLAVKEMSEGELLQIQKSRKLNLSEDEYFEIIGKKTAALIAACCASGTKSVTNDPETISKMKQFGEYIGIAFQIRDDLFDYEKNGLLGKPTGNDIKEKKLTLPLIHALKNTNPAQRKKILRLVRHNNKKTSRVNEVIRFVRDNKGMEYSKEKMNEYKNKALDILNAFPESEARSSLQKLALYTTSRVM
ncbi:MAG: polyprenyl synthetase family protein [Bacteroidales bacterium]|nr:polyprenyl synthetase family protein [Bacteroidales bacterium]